MSPMWKDIKKDDRIQIPKSLNPHQLLMKQLSPHTSFPREAYGQQTWPGSGVVSDPMALGLTTWSRPLESWTGPCMLRDLPRLWPKAAPSCSRWLPCPSPRGQNDECLWRAWPLPLLWLSGYGGVHPSSPFQDPRMHSHSCWGCWLLLAQNCMFSGNGLAQGDSHPGPMLGWMRGRGQWRSPSTLSH